MRDPGRRDGDDARPDPGDSGAPQAGSAGDPADDAAAGVPSPAASEDAFPDAGFPDFPDLDDGLSDVPDLDDDFLFDPLLSDEPIDLAAVRADDALIDALAGGDLAAADDVVDPDDPLIAMLAAWAASARPDAEPTPAPAERVPEAPILRSVAETSDDEETDSPDSETDDSDDASDADGAATDVPQDLDLPTVRLAAPAFGATRPAADPPPAATPEVPPAAVASAAATPVVRLSRVRTLRRRIRPTGQALPSDHPLRRAAVAVVVAALGISGAAASGGTALPGDPAWSISKVFFAERARSIEAAQVVAAGLERAQVLLSKRQPDLAARELAAVSAALKNVREEEGHTRLVDQQRMLQAVVALTPPLPNDPNLTATATPTRPADPDTSVLAQDGPGTKPKDPAAGAPAPVLTEPAEGPGEGTATDATDPAAGGTDAETVTTDPATTDTATGSESGTTGTDTGSTDTETTDTTGTDTGTTGTETTGTETTGTETTGTETTGTETDTTGTDTDPADTTDTGPADTTDDPGTTGTDPGDTDPGATGTAPAGTAPADDTPADDTGRVSILDALDQPSAPVETEAADTPTAEPSATPAPQVAEGSAPAVPASGATEEQSDGDDTVRPLRETGVVPAPVNVDTEAAAPETDTDAAADTPPADDPAPDTTREPADDPEPVRVSTDEPDTDGHSGDGDDRTEARGDDRDDDHSGPGDGDDRDTSSDDNSDDHSGRDDGERDGPAGARLSAAVSIG